MKILFIIPYVPNLIRVRPYNLLHSLKSQGHQVTLLTLWSSADELDDLGHLSSHGFEVVPFHLSKPRAAWNCMLALPSSSPLQSAYSWHPRLSEQVKSLLEQSSKNQAFDLIHVEHMRGVRYGLSIKAWGRGGSDLGFPIPPIVWDSVDCISHLFRQASDQSKRTTSRWITRFELSRTERYEAWLTGQFEQILVTSKIDRDAFLSLADGTRQAKPIHILTNGVDLDYFKPDQSRPRETDSLVVSGKMSYHANISMVIHLVEDIMPRVWQKHPTTRLYIVGKDPTSDVLRLGQDPRVIVTGTVPDLRAYLRRASIAVSPIPYGAGIQNKILEAMACEIPVITSPLGAAALKVKSGREVIIAENSQSFADAVDNLLQKPGLSQKIAREGRRYVEENHSWNKITARLVAIYEEAINQSHNPAPVAQ